MELRSIRAVGLQLRAYAPALRLMARVVEQVLFIDPKDSVVAADVFSRVVTYLRNLANEIAVAQDAMPTFSVAKTLVDATDQFQETVSLNTQKACSDLSAALDRLALIVGRSVNDSQPITEKLAFSTGKSLTDAVDGNAVNELVSLLTGKSFSDSTGTSDALTKVISFNVLLLDGGFFVDPDYADYAYFDHTPAASDSLSLKAAKTFTDSGTTSDTVSRVATQYRTLTDAAVYGEQLSFDNRKNFVDTGTVSESTGKAISLYLLEGGLYADPTYFVSSDYVTGGLVASESLTHSP